MIIGNKCDLEAERAVETLLASSKITELGLSYTEVSAKTGANIKQFFKELATVIAGGKKPKEEASSKNNQAPQVKKPTDEATNASIKASGTVSLSPGQASSQNRKSKKCC